MTSPCRACLSNITAKLLHQSEERLTAPLTLSEHEITVTILYDYSIVLSSAGVVGEVGDMAPSKAKSSNTTNASSPSDTSMVDSNGHTNGGHDEDSIMVGKSETIASNQQDEIQIKRGMQ